MAKVKLRYKVCGKGEHFETLDEALVAAAGFAASRPAAFAMVQDVQNHVFVAVVTDDANGIKAEKLYGWPSGVKFNPPRPLLKD